MHEANALTKRIIKYVACVSFLSVLFTATRFFEAEVIYTKVVNETTNETLRWDGPNLRPTAFRTNPYYITYFNWSRLIVLGIIPFAMLVYLNTKIYQVG